MEQWRKVEAQLNIRCSTAPQEPYTTYDLRERLDAERREKDALKAEVDVGVRLKDVCAKTEKDLRARHAISFPMLCSQTQQFLIEAASWSTTPFRTINPCWPPILYQKAIEYEFSERVWEPVRKSGVALPKEFDYDRLTINQINRLLGSTNPLIKGLVRSIAERFKISMALPPLLADALHNLKGILHVHGTETENRIQSMT